MSVWRGVTFKVWDLAWSLGVELLLDYDYDAPHGYAIIAVMNPLLYVDGLLGIVAWRCDESRYRSVELQLSCSSRNKTMQNRAPVVRSTATGNFINRYKNTKSVLEIEQL